MTPHGQPPDRIDFPKILEIEPIHACNFRCIMCHVPGEHLTSEKVDVDRILKQLEEIPDRKERWVGLASMYEPVMHPRFTDLVNGLTELGFKIYVTTNGAMLSKRVVDKIAASRIEHVTISFDGIRKETYESTRVGAKFEKTIERILYFKSHLENPSAYFQINYVLMRRNIDEVLDALDFWESHGFDHLGFIGMTVRSLSDEVKNENVQPVLDTVRSRLEALAERIIDRRYKITSGASFLTGDFALRRRKPENFKSHMVFSDNPEARLPFNPRVEFQQGRMAGMPVPCVSPYTSARIFYNGDVLICHKIGVGNIMDDTFANIWRGERAALVRHKLMTNPKICYSCGYYRFCINGANLDMDDDESYVGTALMGCVKQKYYVPTKVAQRHDYNIVGWMDQFYAVHRSLGNFDIRFDETEEERMFFVRDTQQEVEARVDQISAELPAKEITLKECVVEIRKNLETRNIEHAVFLSFEMVRHFESNPMAWLTHANVMKLLKRSDEQLDAVERSIEVMETPQALVSLLDIKLERGETAEAGRIRKALEKYRQGAPDTPV